MAIQNIYCDSNNSVAGDGSFGSPYKAFSAINWTTVANWITAGDSVRINLKRASHWRELLTVGAAGVSGRPIILQAYGAGTKPIVNGADLVTGWVASGAGLGSTWQATCGATASNLCMINGIYHFAGASATTLNNGEWYKSGTTLYFRWDNGNPDSEGVTVELGQRSSLSNNNRAYITYDDLELRYANTSGIDNQNATGNQTFLNLLFTDCNTGIGYRGAGGVMKYCSFVRGGGSTAQLACTADAAGTLDIQYCEFKDSQSRNIRTQYGSGFTIDNCTFNGAKTENVYNTVNTTLTMRNCIVSGCGFDADSTPIVSSAGTFNLSNSIVVPSLTGKTTSGVTIGSGVVFTDPKFKKRAFTGILSWGTDDGNYVYARNTGDALRLVSPTFEGAYVADYNTNIHTAPQITAMQAMVAAGDEIAGHTRHGVGGVTTLTAIKVFCSNFGTSATVTISISGNTLTTSVDSVTDLSISLVNASYDTLTELVAYLNGRTGLSGVVYGSTLTGTGAALSYCLADITGVDIRVASPGTQLSFDQTRYWTEEIVNSRTDIESFIGDGYTAPTFIYPQGSTSAALISFLLANNFVGGRTASATGMSTYCRNLDYFNVFGTAAPSAHGLLLNLRCAGNLNDSSGNSYTFTGSGLGSYASNLYFRLPTDYGNSANFTGTSYIYRASMAKLDYRNRDWSFGVLIRPTTLSGGSTYTLFYHGDATGTSNYMRLWLSGDGAAHFEIVQGGVAVVTLSTAAGLFSANNTQAIAIRQQNGKIELLANSSPSTGTNNNVIATTIYATSTADNAPGNGAATYTGNIYIGASSDGAGGVTNNYSGYMSDIYMGQDTARIAIGVCNALTATGQYMIFMHHADVPYDVIRNYADTVKLFVDSGGSILIKTIKSAMAYLLANGTKTSDSLRIRWIQSAQTDLSLQTTSPAIDAATDLSYTLDLAGKAVPNGAAPDIGAYEYYLSFSGQSRGRNTYNAGGISRGRIS